MRRDAWPPQRNVIHIIIKCQSCHRRLLCPLVLLSGPAYSMPSMDSPGQRDGQRPQHHVLIVIVAVNGLSRVLIASYDIGRTPGVTPRAGNDSKANL